MASLWIRSGCDMKVDPSVETYQVGAHFKALIKAILVAPSRILDNFFFHFMSPCRAAGVPYGYTAIKRHVFTCSGKIQLNVTSVGAHMGGIAPRNSGWRDR